MNDSEPKKLSFNLEAITVCDNNKVELYEKKLNEIKKQEAYERYKNSGVPAKFFDTSLDTFIAETEEEKKNLATVKDFINDPQNKILLLCGNNGNGKSHLLSGITRECGGEYITSSQLCVEYEAATSFHSERTREQILKHYTTVSMLVIDECGKYTVNEKLEQFILAYVFCGRYENDLPSAAATNGDKKGFIEFLGKSVFDRFTEVCTTLDFTGPSKRQARRTI
jgi:DNA replication protein DnaC